MKLLDPIAAVASRDTPPTGTPMLMPEATMDQHNLTFAYEDEVRIARQVAAVKAEAIPERMGQTTNEEFRSSVFGGYPRHYKASFPGTNGIHGSIPKARTRPLEWLSIVMCQSRLRQRDGCILKGGRQTRARTWKEQTRQVLKGSAL